jgi:hypothetical protein
VGLKLRRPLWTSRPACADDGRAASPTNLLQQRAPTLNPHRQKPNDPAVGATELDSSAWRPLQAAKRSASSQHDAAARRSHLQAGPVFASRLLLDTS